MFKTANSLPAMFISIIYACTSLLFTRKYLFTKLVYKKNKSMIKTSLYIYKYDFIHPFTNKISNHIFLKIKKRLHQLWITPIAMKSFIYSHNIHESTVFSAH